MKIKRTYKNTSLKRGTSEHVSEETVRIVAAQTMMGNHGQGQCSRELCEHCPEPAMRKLEAGGVIESFFSKFQLVEE
ncbi:MAG: hypothetical protein AABN95_08035 [Acidobacteriota bacterium]